MIQKAIVEAIENDYQVKVRIPKYDKMATDGSTYNELSTGIICSVPGTLVNYSVGDVVLVAFENDEISKPVVLGLLYTDTATESTVKLPELSGAIASITDSLAQIKNANVYVHIKYSNDGGTTFTSFYDYADIEAVSADTYKCSDIEVNVKSKYIAWNIVDKNNENAIDKFIIKTNITASYGNEEYRMEGIETPVVNIPDSYNFCDKITVDYTLTVLDGNINDYYISLFTDKDPIGSVAGDYIGIYYSTSNVPSANPIDYSWGSLKSRLQEFIDEAYNDLLWRIQRNERYLYGQAVEDETSTNTGIEDAVTVLANSFNISKKSNIVLSANSAIKIDTIAKALYFNNIKLIASADGHLKVQI